MTILKEVGSDRAKVIAALEKLIVEIKEHDVEPRGYDLLIQLKDDSSSHAHVWLAGFDHARQVALCERAKNRNMQEWFGNE